jgi:phytoene dehydrogenase-like protein
MLRSEYDVIVIGGGHNGLTSAAYLARAGLSVLVLESRERAGGIGGPVEYFPGFTASMPNSPGSLQPAVVSDLELERYGLRFVRPDPSLVYPFAPDSAFIGWRDRDRVVQEIEKFSVRDSITYFQFFDQIGDFVSRLGLSLFEPPPPFPDVVRDLLPSDEKFLHTLLFGSTRELLEETFESEEVRALVGSTIATAGMNSPSTPGSFMGFILRPLGLRAEQPAGEHDPRRQVFRGSTGLPIGGMGAITVALAASFTAAGGTIRTLSRVARIGRKSGDRLTVELESGEVFSAPTVVSAINARTTFVDLLDEDLGYDETRLGTKKLPMRGSLFKIGLALDGVPKWSFAEGEDVVRFAGCQFRVAPSLDAMDAAALDAQNGIPSREPLLWGLVPSMTDPSLAPAGKQVMSINAFHAPYALAPGLSWEHERDVFGERCIDTLAAYMPNLRDILIDRRFWTPVELAEEYSLVDGDISHGEMQTRSMMSFRPMPGWRGYRSPVPGLYLGGASVWPGGGITGLPGRNSAMQVLADLKQP